MKVLKTTRSFDEIPNGETKLRIRRDRDGKLYTGGVAENIRDAKTGNRILLLNLGEGMDGKPCIRSFIEGQVSVEIF